jgi:hypothetical protein
VEHRLLGRAIEAIVAGGANHDRVLNPSPAVHDHLQTHGTRHVVAGRVLWVASLSPLDGLWGCVRLHDLLRAADRVL